MLSAFRLFLVLGLKGEKKHFGTVILSFKTQAANV